MTIKDSYYYDPTLLPVLWGSPWEKQKTPSLGTEASLACDLTAAEPRGVWGISHSLWWDCLPSSQSAQGCPPCDRAALWPTAGAAEAQAGCSLCPQLPSSQEHTQALLSSTVSGGSLQPRCYLLARLLFHSSSSLLITTADTAFQKTLMKTPGSHLCCKQGCAL